MKKVKKYLEPNMFTKFSNLDFDFKDSLKMEELKQSQSKLIKELRGRRYLNSDQVNNLLDVTGMHRRGGDNHSYNGSD
jgi:hypothetical protein